LERCISSGTFLQPNPFYNSHYQIIQNRDHIVLISEYLQEVRIIPLDGRPPLGPALTKWGGESRGRWEGDTLVIETGNFNSKTGLFGGTDKLHLVERFTKTDADTIEYRLTVSDPASFTQPWTELIPFRRFDGRIYPFECHEGNYGLPNILSGARATDKARAEKAEKAEKEAR
jgi:hypothetical protein